MRLEALWTVGLAALVSLQAGPARGHHSVARFDVDTTLSLEGTVTSLEWANPHVYIHLEGRDDAGNEAQWMIEAGPPNLMSRSGWSRDSLVAGESITAVVHPMRSGHRNVVLGNAIVKQDRTILPIRETSLPSALTTPEGSTAVAADIFGRWLPLWDLGLASRFLQPATGWSVTEEGRAAVEAYDGSENPSQDCNFEKPPFSMIWPSPKDIVADGDSVRIRYELSPDRVIHLNSTTHQGAPYTPDGHSIGHFEGGTLVVDTDHFAAHRRGLGQGLPSSEQKHLVERFELDASGTQIAYRFEVEDPVYLAEPMTGTIRLAYRPNVTFESVECDPDIARRYLDYE
jgi:hypothetical protein